MTSTKSRPPLIPGETRSYPVLPLRDIVAREMAVAECGIRENLAKYYGQKSAPARR
jgi:hypothetical protein